MGKKKLPVIIGLFFIFVATAYGGSLAKTLKMINNAAPRVITDVIQPYLNEKRTMHASSALRLALYGSEPNQIVDEEDWFDRNGLSYPRAIADHVKGIPQSTRFGELKYLRDHNKRQYAVYETVYLLKDPRDIYNEGHRYALVVIDAGGETTDVFILDSLFPDILEMCWFEAIDDLVYFNATYNGYAEIRDEKTGYLYCIDVATGTVRWATKNLISSYRGFIMYKDHVVTGYGFTAEPDYLYVVNRFNGEVTQTIPIKTAHEYIIIKSDRCYVRTYNTNYIYQLIE